LQAMNECVEEMSKCYEKDELERMRDRSFLALAKVSKECESVTCYT